MKELVVWGYRRPLVRTALSYALAGAVFYFGSLLEQAAQNAFGTSLPRSVLIFGLLIVGGILYGLIATVVRDIAAADDREELLQRDALLYAASAEVVE